MSFGVILAVSVVHFIMCSLSYRYAKKISISIFFIGTLAITGGYMKRKSIWSWFFGTRRSIERTLQGPSCAINAKVMSFDKDPYYLHVSSAKNLPDISAVATKKERDELVQKGALVPLKNNTGYRVEWMRYGSAHLHPHMLARIQEIETRFLEKQKEKGISGVNFIITSAYRTTQQQKDLRKVNPTATKGTSSHSFGASVDIARLQGKHCTKARPLLEEIIQEMQKEEKLYLCPESKTLHITYREGKTKSSPMKK